MPEYLRSLVVVVGIATVVFLLLQRSFGPLMPPGAYERRRNAFLALTVCAFIAPGFWFYALPAAVIVLLAARRETNIPALFFALLFAVPAAPERIPGMGLVNFLIELDHPRLLALLLLLPAAVVVHRNAQGGASRWPDRFFAAFILLQAALVLSRSTTYTSGLRGVVYLLIDAVLPYYVMSRAFTSMGQLKDALAAFCLSGVVLGAIAIFESGKQWLLYSGLLDHWGIDIGLGHYLRREGILRASVSSGHPIVLGFVLVIALTCLLGLKEWMRPGLKRKLAFVLLLGGLAATVSRGPWLGAAVAAVAFWAMANAARLRIGVAIAVAAGLAILVDTQLPFLAALRGVDPATVEYRAELFSKSMQVFMERPWLGSDQYVQKLTEMGMVQGQGIVDIVNTYLGVALSSGALGLTFFLSIFTIVLRGIWKSGRQYAHNEAQGLTSDAASATASSISKSQGDFPTRQTTLLGRVLLASLLGILVTIGSASSVSVIPWVYWAWIGTSVAYLRVAFNNSNKRSSVPP
jgi:hypothetical protein